MAIAVAIFTFVCLVFVSMAIIEILKAVIGINYEETIADAMARWLNARLRPHR